MAHGVAGARRSKSASSGERGQILIITPIVLLTLVAFMGLAFDIGYLFFQKRKMQAATDAAVVGALQELLHGASTVSAQLAAKRDAGLNGFVDGVDSVVTTLNNPPLSGPHTGDANYVEAVVSQPQPTFFMRVLNFSSVPITTRAQGRMGPGSDCVFLIDPAAQDQLLVDGTFTSSCGVMASSTSYNALHVNSGSATASSFSTAGNYVGTFNPTPSTGVPPAPDPLAYLAPPTFPPNNFYGTVVTNSTPLNPGVYHGGILVKAGVHAYFNPGVYVLNGGVGLYGQGGPNTFLEGTGVTFYFTANQPVPNPPNGFNAAVTTTPAVFLMDGQGGASLVAPTSGPMAGILFFQDRNPANQGTPFDIQGTNTSKFEGTLYIPGADLRYQNNTTNTAAYTIIVAKTLRLNGGSANLAVQSDYSSLANGSPLKTVPVLTQ